MTVRQMVRELQRLERTWTGRRWAQVSKGLVYSRISTAREALADALRLAQGARGGHHPPRRHREK